MHCGSDNELISAPTNLERPMETLCDNFDKPTFLSLAANTTYRASFDHYIGPIFSDNFVVSWSSLALICVLYLW